MRTISERDYQLCPEEEREQLHLGRWEVGDKAIFYLDEVEQEGIILKIEDGKATMQLPYGEFRRPLEELEEIPSL